jgi:hypothetical protein
MFPLYNNKYKKTGINIIYSITDDDIKNVLLNFGIEGIKSCC